MHLELSYPNLLCWVFGVSIFSESDLPYALASEGQLICVPQNNGGLLFTHHMIYHMKIQNHWPSECKAAEFVDKDSTGPVLQVWKLKVSIMLDWTTWNANIQLFFTHKLGTLKRSNLMFLVELKL